MEGEDRAATEELTDEAQQRQREGEAEANTHAVECAVEYALLSRYGFGTPEDDTVHHDQRDEEAEGSVERGDESLHEHLHDGHEASDDDDEAWDAHGVGDEVLDERDSGIGADEHEHRGQTHRQPVERGGRGRQRGAHPQEEYEGRVLRRDPVANDIEWFHRRDYS